MKTLLILLAQTKFTATMEIVGLLLVAGIIGFFTAWFYSKSISTKKIEALESEIDNLKQQLGKLNAENNTLQGSLNDKEDETKHLTMEVKALKALHAEAVQEINDNKLKNKKTEQKLYEKDTASKIPTPAIYHLNYDSFGKATENEKDDLKMISGIGPYIEEKLHDLGIFTFKQISNLKAKDIADIDEAIESFSGRIERDQWIEQAKELIIDEKKRDELLEAIRVKKSLLFYDRIGIALKEEADDLTEISGIGGWISKKLNALDIYTFRQISNFTDEDIEIVRDAIEFFPGRIERDEWILQARELVRTKISMSEHMEKISVMKNRIFYDRLGIAHKHHANNLTLIKGISSWIEDRLNILEIYTFKQISNLTTEDIEIITDILELASSRIQQDKWVEQAQVLTKLKEK
ncbi:MAG: hypothetical protein PHW19_09970 [Salinivirgaceae bacterium]|nr:hypothetical protein [Salinivirgaceae bacterium]